MQKSVNIVSQLLRNVGQGSRRPKFRSVPSRLASNIAAVVNNHPDVRESVLLGFSRDSKFIDKVFLIAEAPLFAAASQTPHVNDEDAPASFSGATMKLLIWESPDSEVFAVFPVTPSAASMPAPTGLLCSRRRSHIRNARAGQEVHDVPPQSPGPPPSAESQQIIQALHLSYAVKPPYPRPSPVHLASLTAPQPAADTKPSLDQDHNRRSSTRYILVVNTGDTLRCFRFSLNGRLDSSPSHTPSFGLCPSNSVETEADPGPLVPLPASRFRWWTARQWRTPVVCAGEAITMRDTRGTGDGRPIRGMTGAWGHRVYQQDAKSQLRLDAENELDLETLLSRLLPSARICEYDMRLVDLVDGGGSMLVAGMIALEVGCPDSDRQPSTHQHPERTQRHADNVEHRDVTAPTPRTPPRSPNGAEAHLDVASPPTPGWVRRIPPKREAVAAVERVPTAVLGDVPAQGAVGGVKGTAGITGNINNATAPKRKRMYGRKLRKNGRGSTPTSVGGTSLTALFAPQALTAQTTAMSAAATASAPAASIDVTVGTIGFQEGRQGETDTVVAGGPEAVGVEGREEEEEEEDEYRPIRLQRMQSGSGASSSVSMRAQTLLFQQLHRPATHDTTHRGGQRSSVVTNSRVSARNGTHRPLRSSASDPLAVPVGGGALSDEALRFFDPHFDPSSEGRVRTVRCRVLFSLDITSGAVRLISLARVEALHFTFSKAGRLVYPLLASKRGKALPQAPPGARIAYHLTPVTSQYVTELRSRMRVPRHAWGFSRELSNAPFLRGVSLNRLVGSIVPVALVNEMKEEGGGGDSPRGEAMG